MIYTHNLPKEMVEELEERGFAESLIRQIDYCYPGIYYYIPKGVNGKKRIKKEKAEELLGFNGFVTGVALCGFEEVSNVRTRDGQTIVIFISSRARDKNTKS